MQKIKTGRPGAGKSYGGVLDVVEELAFGSKFVLTNLALDLWALQMFFIRRNLAVDVFARVRILSREECMEFWRHRGRFTVLPNEWQALVDDVQGLSFWKTFGKWFTKLKRNKVSSSRCVEVMAELTKKEEPVLYIIDEAHILFDSRSWADTAPELTYYNSQHRKLRDEGVFITQFLGLIEKRVKGFAEEFHVYRNFAGASMMNFLAMPKRMRELVFTVEPTANMKNHEADRETWRKLDREIAAVYDTSAGVGLSGGTGAESRMHRRWQIPWWTVFFGIFALVGLVVYVPGCAVKSAFLQFTHVTGPGGKGASLDTTKKGVLPKSGGNLPLAAVFDSAGAAAEASVGRGYIPDGVVVTGVLMGRGNVMVTLSDGRRFRANEIAHLDEDKVTLRDGSVFYRAVPSARPGGPASKDSSAPEK